MRLSTPIFPLITIVLLMANAVDAIAKTAALACNCPNNCMYGENESCKYYSDVNVGGNAVFQEIMAGACKYNDEQVLTCQDASIYHERRRRMVKVRRREGSTID
ncbi:hypothetical protein C8R42DRAFT_279716 [Lentinula raphanica]|nr:hypothetical protein C8R42DRAFT_279716 [Lentinula raphanica]